MPTIEQRQAYEEQGFFIVDDLVDADTPCSLRVWSAYFVYK